MKKSFITLTMAAAALAASIPAALPADARGPFGIPLPPPPSVVYVRTHLPPLPPPPFFVGPVRHGHVWVPERYYGDWIHTDGEWRRRPHSQATWSRGYRDRHRGWVPGGWSRGGRRR